MFEVISQFWSSFSLSWEELCIFSQLHMDKDMYFKICWSNLFPIDFGDCDYRVLLLTYFLDIRRVPLKRIVDDVIVLENCYLLWHDTHTHFACNLMNAQRGLDDYSWGFRIPVHDLTQLDISNAKICLLLNNGTKILPIKYKDEKWIDSGCDEDNSRSYTRVIIPNRDQAMSVRVDEKDKTREEVLAQIFGAQDLDEIDDSAVDWDNYIFDVNEIDFELAIDKRGYIIIDDPIMDKWFKMNQNIDLETDYEGGQWDGRSHVNSPLEDEPTTSWLCVI
tara:strand:- start:2687 stop:3517 length:831 start_codon:yes stop_codon:yes gene_type:complete